MAKAIPLDVAVLDAVEPLRQNIERLPVPLRPRMRHLCERLERWLTLRGEALRIARETITEITLQNATLQFDLDCTRRERDELRERS